MSTKPHKDESRLTALTRLDAGLKRLEKHLLKAARRIRQLVQMVRTLQEDAAEFRRLFRESSTVSAVAAGAN